MKVVQHVWVLTDKAESYPEFEIRNLTANGEYWTGRGNETRQRFPPLDGLTDEDHPSENMCSLSFRLRYGAFDYYVGGDLTGIPNIGHPEWQNMETAVARALGPLEVHVVNHHGSIDPASPLFLATLRPRVHIVPAWSATHPAPRMRRYSSAATTTAPASHRRLCTCMRKGLSGQSW